MFYIQILFLSFWIDSMYFVHHIQEDMHHHSHCHENIKPNSILHNIHFLEIQ